jgi:predicted RNA binding protein YcfA (HicA-like mRNA interferase family)
MNYKELLQLLKKEGWHIKNQRGSHIQLTHPLRGGKITLPKHGKKDLKPGTLLTVLKKAGLK